MNKKADDLSDLRRLNLPFNVDDVAPECHECIRNQIKKYENFTYPDGKKPKKFEINCKGIMKHVIPPQEMHKYNEQELINIHSILDPVFFAKHYIFHPGGDKKPFIPRDYQSLSLRCTSPRKVLRWGRRTGKTASICIEIIHRLVTMKKKRIILAAPMIEQVENIFVRVKEFLEANPVLKDSILRMKRSPHELEMKNGSILKGFAAGSVSRGGDGTSIRGQDSDFLYLEEFDYISPQAIIGAVLPILSTSPDTQLVGFSTPLGFKTTPFYKLCNESPEYKEYHFSYKVLPHWKEVEKDKHQFTEEAWIAEYLAEFSETGSGVYKDKYVDAAIKPYEYGTHTRQPYWKYCIGVDWNEKKGAEIVVLGHDPHLQKFTVVEAINVVGAEFTQLKSVAKVVETYKKWRPEYIYVDVGNGSTNIELMIHMAKKAPIGDPIRDFLKILKRYDSGSKIEVLDPFSREKIRKQAKAFMVDASIRMFEQGRIVISDQDYVLEKQLRNYIIERYTESNVPKFGTLDPKVGDHRLDALNLAIVAFQLEFNDLFKNEQVFIGMISGNPLDSLETSGSTTDRSAIATQKKRRNTSQLQNELDRIFNSNGIQYPRNRQVGWGPDRGRKNIVSNSSKSRGSLFKRKPNGTRADF